LRRNFALPEVAKKLGAPSLPRSCFCGKGGKPQNPTPFIGSRRHDNIYPSLLSHGPARIRSAFSRRHVANGGEFQEQIRQLGNLIGQFDHLPDGPQKTACKELVQLLMDVHGAGLGRMMEIVFESGSAGPALIDKLGQDSIAGSLLLLYSLHPDDVETRVQKAMERMRPRLRKLACTAELTSAEAGMVRVQLATTGHSCGSSSKDLRAIVEDCVYEMAPDVVSLEILGLEEPGPAGFVTLDSLLGHSIVGAAPQAQSLHAEVAD
jgi:Fe-S cluster biogenesis protein NfuA